MATTQSADGTSINYVDHGGEGPDVILVHGITENQRFWDPIVERLVDSNRVVTLDLRGHGESAKAQSHRSKDMATDVIAVASALGMTSPRLVGHSLGGIVVSFAGAAIPVESVVNVDQSLALGGFKEMLSPVEGQLRDPEVFPLVMGGLFAGLVGALSEEKAAELAGMRRPDQDVVLGVWDLIFSNSVEDITAVVDAELSSYKTTSTPYLSLHGIDTGPDYAAWLTERIPTAVVELWDEHGHYPHLVDPDRFVSRLGEFWSS